jgi:hypothetical protein
MLRIELAMIHGCAESTVQVAGVGRATVADLGYCLVTAHKVLSTSLLRVTISDVPLSMTLCSGILIDADSET